MGLFTNLFGGEKNEKNEKHIFLDPNFQNEKWFKIAEHGISAMNNQRYTIAVNYFDEAIGLNPTNYFLRSLKATAYEDSKDYVNAIKTYQESLKLNEWYVTYNQIAICQFYIQDYQNSLNAYDKALALKVDDSTFMPANVNGVKTMVEIERILTNRGNCKLSLGDFNGCHQDCDRAIKSMSSYNVPYFIKGLCYLQQGNNKDAHDYILKAKNMGHQVAARAYNDIF